LRAGLAGRGGLDDLADDGLGLARMLFEPGREPLVEDAFDHRPHLGRNELILGLRGELSGPAP